MMGRVGHLARNHLHVGIVSYDSNMAVAARRGMMRIAGVSILALVAAISTANAQDQGAAQSKAKWERGFAVDARLVSDFSSGLDPVAEGNPLFAGPSVASWGGQPSSFPMSVGHGKMAVQGRPLGLPNYELTGALKIAEPGDYRFRIRFDFENRSRKEIAFACSARMVVSGNEYLAIDRQKLGDTRSGPRMDHRREVSAVSAVVPLEKGVYSVDGITVGCVRSDRNLEALTQRLPVAERQSAYENGYADVPTVSIEIAKGDGGFRPLADTEVYHDANTVASRSSATVQAIPSEKLSNHENVKAGLIIGKASTVKPGLEAVSESLATTGGIKAGFASAWQAKVGEIVQATGFFVPPVGGTYTLAVESRQNSCDRDDRRGRPFRDTDRALAEKINDEVEEKGFGACATSHVFLTLGNEAGKGTVAPVKAGAELVAVTAVLDADGVYPVAFRSAVDRDLAGGETVYAYRLLVKGPKDVGLRPVVQEEVKYRLSDLPESMQGKPSSGVQAPSKADFDAMK